MLSRDSALALLKRHGQEHLLRFWADLDDAARRNLLADIASVDFDFVARLHRETMGGTASANPSAGDITPLRGIAFDSLPVAERSVLSNTGHRLLRDGKVAALLVAGGQGTRLGFDGPKGAFDIGLPSGKSLFQLQGERLLHLSRRCGRPIPWMIMTSRENHANTRDFLESHAQFGLDPGQTTLFPQGELPLLDFQGKILLAEKHRMALGPNGNGGCFAALKDSGNLAALRKRGVEWVFVYGVDNALVRVCDPCFLGMAESSGHPVAAKVVARKGPGERVGVFCRRNGLPSVIEYSEMTPEMASATDASGALAYGAANIAIHLFRLDFLERVAGDALPTHVARKKIPHIDENGNPVSPREPNACKFEMFMFDLFAPSGRMCLMDVAREEEFAPVKNPSGIPEDSPDTARHLVLDLHRRWALEAGYTPAELEGLEIEVSPLTSYAGENLSKAGFHRDASRPVLIA